MKLFISILIMLACLPVAMACKVGPVAYDLAAFLKEKKATTVVVLARVESSKEVALTEFGRRQDLILSVSRRWLGPQSRTLSAEGYVVIQERSDCDASFSFSAKVGEQWLIVGETDSHGVVRPSKLLSRRLQNGKLSNEDAVLLRDLERKINE